MSSLAVVIDLIGRDGASPAFLAMGKNADKASASVAKAETGVLGFSKKASAALGAIVAVDIAGHMIKSAVQFQRSMLVIQTQAGASAAEVKSMSTAVLGLAGSVGTAPEKLATSLYHIESVGLRGADALKALKIAAEGSKVGNADLEDTTNALTATIASGIAGTKNYGKAMGELNAIVGSGDMKLSDLNDALGTGLLAAVKGFGVTLPQAGAALAVFGDNNIRGADAATALRQSVMAMAKPIVGGTMALKSIGIASGELNKDLSRGGLTTALDDLRQKMTAAGVTGSKVGGFITNAFGRKAGTGLAVLLEEMDRYHTKLGVISSAGDRFGAAWSATTKTAAFQFDKIKASADAVGITIGTALLPAVSKAASVIGGALMDSVSIVAAAMKPFAVAWQDLSVIFGPIGSLLGAIGSALGPLAPALKVTAAAVLALWAGMKAGQLVSVAFTAIGGAIETMQIKALYAQDAVSAGWARMSGSAAVAATETGVAAAAIGAEAEGASTTVVASGEAAEAGWAGLAGPIGIAAVGVFALISLFHKSSSASKEASQAAKAYGDVLKDMGSGAAGGAVLNDTIVKRLADKGVATTLVTMSKGLKDASVNGTAFVKAISQGGKPLATLRDRLQQIALSGGTVKGGAAAQLNSVNSAITGMNPRAAAAGKLLKILHDETLGLTTAQKDEIKNFKAFGTVVTPLQTVAEATGLSTQTIQAYAAMMGLAATKNNNFGGSSKEVIAAVQTIATAYAGATASGSDFLASLQSFSTSAGTAADRAGLIGAILKANAGDALGYASTMNAAATATAQLGTDVASAAKGVGKGGESTGAFLRSIINLKNGSIEFGKTAAAPLISNLQSIQTAAINAASGTYQNELATRGAGKASADAVAQYRGVENSLVGQLQKLGLTKTAAQQLTDKYLGVPSRVSTLIAQAGAGSVTSILNKIGTQLSYLTGHAWNVPVDITVNQSVGKAVHDAVNSVGKATGGSVIGRGTATSDSIPARLSNGEHVLTASDVKKAGGQGAIYRMRSMIQGGLKFASGGHVDKSAFASLLAGLGATRSGIAGFFGNTSAESGFRLDAIGGPAHGLQQWQDGRFTALQRLASKLGVSWKSQKAQFAMITKELHKSRFAPTLAALRSNKSASEIANIVNRNYEGSADHSGNRARLARLYYQKLKSGSIPVSATGGDITTGTTTNAKGKKSKVWIFDGQQYASLRAAQNAQARIGSTTAKDLKNLRIKINGSDLLAFKKALTGTVADTRSALSTLLADADKAGASNGALGALRKQGAAVEKAQTSLIQNKARLTTMQQYGSSVSDTLTGGFSLGGFGSTADFIAGAQGAKGTTVQYQKELASLRLRAKGNKQELALVNALAPLGQTDTLQSLYSDKSAGSFLKAGAAYSGFTDSVTHASSQAVLDKFGETLTHQAKDVQDVAASVDKLGDAVVTLAHAIVSGNTKQIEAAMGGLRKNVVHKKAHNK